MKNNTKEIFSDNIGYRDPKYKLPSVQEIKHFDYKKITDDELNNLLLEANIPPYQKNNVENHIEILKRLKSQNISLLAKLDKIKKAQEIENKCDKIEIQISKSTIPVNKGSKKLLVSDNVSRNTLNIDKETIQSINKRLLPYMLKKNIFSSLKSNPLVKYQALSLIVENKECKVDMICEKFAMEKIDALKIAYELNIENLIEYDKINETLSIIRK